MRRNHASTVLAGIVLSISLGLGAAANAETLRIGGTGVALGGMTLLAAAFEKQNPGTTVEVLPSLGSSGGVKALIAGAIDLSVSSRDLKDAEREKGASARQYATTPLAVVTSMETDVEAVTTTQLVDAYSGTMTHWPSGVPIRVVLRPLSETDTKLLRGLSDEMAAAVDLAHERPGLVTATNDQDNASALERLPGSLGLVAMGQIATEQRRLKVLSLDGEVPQSGDASGRAATFSKTLYLVTTKDIKPLASDFLAYVFSEEGQALLAEFDHWPVR